MLMLSIIVLDDCQDEKRFPTSISTKEIVAINIAGVLGTGSIFENLLWDRRIV